MNGNIYGLTTSPRDWSDHRDLALKSLEWSSEGRKCWLQKTREENLWRIKSQVDGSEQTVGHLAVYLDDLLATGEEPVLKSFFFDGVQKEWAISEPEWCKEDSILRFCGDWQQKVRRGTDFSSMESLIAAKKNEFPVWLQTENIWRSEVRNLKQLPQIDGGALSRP